MDKIEVIEEYLKYFPNDANATKNLLLCKYSSELGIELGNGYYPKIEYGYFVGRPLDGGISRHPRSAYRPFLPHLPRGRRPPHRGG